MSANLNQPKEARRATHDGFIWPVDRHLMTERGHVLERMVEDATALARDIGPYGQVERHHLRSKGWREEQLNQFYAQAVELFAALRRRGEIILPKVA